MAYLLDNINLSTYGILPGQHPGGNIAILGCFDMPARIGDTERDWGDDDGVEPYVDADEIFFGGRDLVFTGLILGTNSEIHNYITTLREEIDWGRTIHTLSTPYGDYSVLVKSITAEHHNGISVVTISFREPVVDISGGTLPASGVSDYAIDNIPMQSFGLYVSKPEGMVDAPELKPMQFTKYGAEGYQMTKRQINTLQFDGFILGNSLTEFQNNIKALYKVFSASGMRTIKVRGIELGEYFMKDGFKVTDVHQHQ